MSFALINIQHFETVRAVRYSVCSLHSLFNEAELCTLFAELSKVASQSHIVSVYSWHILVSNGVVHHRFGNPYFH